MRTPHWNKGILALAAWLLLGVAQAALGANPGQKHWSGGGATANWSEGANWTEFVPPVAGDLLIFPDGVARNMSFNDLATQFSGILVTNNSAGHTFNGNQLQLTGDIPIRIVSTGGLAIFHCEVQLYSHDAMISLMNPAPTPGTNMPQVQIRNRLYPAGGMLRFDAQPSGSTVYIPGAIQDSFGTTISFNGFADLQGDNRLTAPIQANGNLMIVHGSPPLGVVNAGITVNFGVLMLGLSSEPAPTAIPRLDLRAPYEPSRASVVVLGSPGGTTTLNAPISVTGTQSLGFGTITGVLNSVVSGSGKLVLWPQGGERLYFGNRDSTFTGGLQIYGGTVYMGVNDAFPAVNDLEIRDATLELRSRQTVRGFTCYSGTLDVELGASINVTGLPAMSNGCVLRISVGAGLVIPANGEIVLLRSVAGYPWAPFVSLPEGASVVVNGTTMAITYHGGAGNDVALIAPSVLTASPPSVVTNANSMFAFGVVVTSPGGAPRPGARVNFEMPVSAGASMVTSSAVTDAAGRATAQATAGAFAANYAIVARYGGQSANIAVTQMGGTPPATRSVRGLAPNGRPITLSAFTSESGCAISNAQFLDPRVSLLSAIPPATLAFPQGLLDFRVDNCGVGQPVSFAIEFTDPLPPTATYWKYGPTPDSRAPHWYAMPGRIDGNRFTFTIVDGGVGDDDLIANGSITDMGGLAFNGGALQDLWWSGTAENGWGMSLIQHHDMLVANVYIYDDLGRPMWLIMSGGAWNAARTAFTGALYIPHSSPYYAYDVTRFNIGAPVGTATFTFSGENNAVFEYTINGIAGRKDITRLAFGRPDTAAAASIGDLWWGGINQNGWGITVLQQLRTLFALWFTYDAAGAPTWYVMPGGEWTASDTYEGRIYRAVGPKWIGATYDPAQHRTIDVGSYRLRFTGDNASFEYTIDGRSGTEPLTRLGF